MPFKANQDRRHHIPKQRHHNVLGPRDADHLLQARGAARTRDLAETLLGKGIKAGFRGEPEIAGQRQLEANAEAIAAAGSNDRLTAARRGGDVPGEARDMLGRGAVPRRARDRRPASMKARSRAKASA